MTLDPSIAAEWKSHTEYYNCSKYEENKESFNLAEVTSARKALKKYLFYYERVREHWVGCVWCPAYSVIGRHVCVGKGTC